MFNKLLIANRGEIACRIIKTARRFAIPTVAIYSEADRHALHVQLADFAFCVGPAPAAESYLNIEEIIKIAEQANVDAIHPGYGFLSENADFARACEQACIHFIGPSADAIEAMGSKQNAKCLMDKAKVPTVPGYHGKDQSEQAFAKAISKMGYPVLIKAAAGGGGKGMRVVERADDLNDALQAAKREAQSSFADPTLIVEKYLANPRHIEIQIFADRQGTVVHLYERDCSIQRRHQKIIEEAPAPGVSAQLRNKMGMAAIAAAKAIEYEGAGTVEFLLDDDQKFYFMEMNTRLQVEHPVTEMITGIDLVEWQLLIAAGEPLPLIQKDIPLNGHAIEARLYAEDPEQNFLPSTGELTHWDVPTEDDYTRIDTGVKPGDSISQYYDPMIAKVIVHGEDRETARQNLLATLQQVHILGIKTNCDYLEQILQYPDYCDAKLNTQFVDQHHQQLFFEDPETDQNALTIAAFYMLTQQQQSIESQKPFNTDPFSPWDQSKPWRLNLAPHQTVRLLWQGEIKSIVAELCDDAFILQLPQGEPLKIRGELQADQQWHIKVGPHSLAVQVISDQQHLAIFGLNKRYFIEYYDPARHYAAAESGAGQLTSPMPATIVAVPVKAGDNVAQGEKLIILEAMKMEHTICAPVAGVIKAIHFKVGDQVEEGVELLQFAS